MNYKWRKMTPNPSLHRTRYGGLRPPPGPVNSSVGPHQTLPMRNVVKQPEALISLLLDEGAEYGDRGDAAMDLGAYDEPAAEEALLEIVLDQTEHEGIADSAGESLWQIWKRKGKCDTAIVARMHPAARKFFEHR